MEIRLPAMSDMTTKTAARRCAPPAPRDQHGVGLVEVLVSVLILGIGMLGIAAMQATALRYGQSSMETSQAVIQTYSILERIRANRDEAAAYNMARQCSVPAAGGSLVGQDKAAWITALKDTLGTADDATTCGEISGCPGNCKVTVYWDDSRARDGSQTRSISTETIL